MKTKKMKTNYRILFFLLTLASVLRSQPIMIDGGVRAGELMCFPVFGDSLSYRYLPSRGRLAINDQNLPEFSFLRYAVAKEPTPTGIHSISEADGGGLVHFLVLYDTPEDQVRQAENDLRIKFRNPKIKIKGPVFFSKGDYVVVSSVLGQGGKEEKKLIGVGQAPVFENSKVAFSFMLNTLEARLLMESFKMATPDVSIMFDLAFSGLTQAYDAEVEVNWSEVQKSEYYHEKTNILFYSSEVHKSFSELHKTGAIKIRAAGQDSLMAQILDASYEKLLNLMFNPVKPSEIPLEKKGFMEEIFGAGGLASLGLFGASRTYILKELKTEGKSTVSLRSYSTVDRRHLITFNIGNIFEKFGKDKRIFRDVTLDDPVFQQRDVLVSIDGELQGAFEHVVKSAAISFRKSHQNGKETLREVFLSKNTLSENQGRIALSYLNQEDKDRLHWLDYAYQVMWNFGAEGNYQTGWITQNTPIINLYAPYKRHIIGLDADQDKLIAQDVRAISVQIDYAFFGQRKQKRLTVKPGENLSEKYFELTLPIDQQTVDYTITWIKNDGAKVSMNGKDEYGLIFLDELPQK